MSTLSDAVKAANTTLQADRNAAKSTKKLGQAVTDWILATDARQTKAQQTASGLSVPQPYTLDLVADVLRKLLAGWK